MKKILIIGGGFAGLSAADRFGKSGRGLDISLLDKKKSFDFLPLLPDAIGRGIKPEYLIYSIEDLCKKKGIKFINEEAVSIDLEKKKVFILSGVLEYDYLVIASGSETNFYANANIEKNAYKIDSAQDIQRILSVLRQAERGVYIIGGGGYTGIEVATNLRIFLDKVKRKSRIIVVERAPSILGPLPSWMKDYVSDNLIRLSIEVYTNSAIDKIEEDKVYVSGGKIFDSAMVIWAAGVKTAGFMQKINAEKNPQGRLRVDEYLKLNDSCFVAGDTSYFSYNNVFLRMAVQFAVIQGDCVAVNIINSIKGIKLRKYSPLDLGYVVPMANNRSCGIILGFKLRGRLPTFLHFLMCIYRSAGFKNKFGIIGDLIKGGAS